jgi:hypothetical protein
MKTTDLDGSLGEESAFHSVSDSSGEGHLIVISWGSLFPRSVVPCILKSVQHGAMRRRGKMISINTILSQEKGLVIVKEVM